MWVIAMIVCYNSKYVQLNLPKHNDNCEIQTARQIFKTEKECNEFAGKKFFQFKGCIKVEK